jgi:hypothetical protein
MYGGDWVALDYEPDNERYYAMMRQKYVDSFGTQKLAAFLGNNAINFLGLAPGDSTRQRLTDFYRRNGQSPPDFDALRN